MRWRFRIKRSDDQAGPMEFLKYVVILTLFCSLVFPGKLGADEIQVDGKPGRLAISVAGENSMRITLMPEGTTTAPYSPAIVEGDPKKPLIHLSKIETDINEKVGSFNVNVSPSPLSVTVTNTAGQHLQTITFEADGSLTFDTSDQPILGLGEGGPQPAGRGDWRQKEIQLDRNGSYHQMIPRWETNAYGSRNPVACLIGTEGWGLFIATPWGEFDLRDDKRGKFIPWKPPTFEENESGNARERQRQRIERERAFQGRPPVDGIIPGAYDLFVFDAHTPANMMYDLSRITGPAVLPPKWALGYMQSHRELVDKNMSSEELLLWVVDNFRKKQIPLDSVVYLGTGFTPTGWNTRQPSFDFNPRVFKRQPKQVMDDLHDRNVKVIVHMVPWEERRLPTLHGDIPPDPDETLDASHIKNYWQEHVELVQAGIDAWWPDEGDRFNLFERIKRHQLYYQGPLSTHPNVRPWSLHRNGHLGIARWGGWVWSGDTQSAWKTLEGQIAVGINHSLSLSPYWGSDTGGFYTGVNPPELTGELYTRWFQFSSFCPSFRSHGRIWRLRTPFGWGLEQMGDTEGQRFPPPQSEMGNDAIEPVCKKYAELRQQLMPYTYTLTAEARETGLPMMRSMWLHYPQDKNARAMGDQYLWGNEMLIAPVYKKGANTRSVYLPEGRWYDFWTNEAHDGGQRIEKTVDLETMPIYVKAGAIIPYGPVRQYVNEPIDKPTTLLVYTGTDGKYRWYQDDGESQEYLSGKFAWHTINWDEQSRQLSIQHSSGELTQTKQSLLVRLVPSGSEKRIEYDGTPVSVNFADSER